MRQLRRFASTQTVRFAPSPTGALHVGGARTALFNYLVHRRAVLEGRPSAFVLRVDDSDAARNVPGSEAAILGDLEWLGVEWTAGPLRSSERSAVYAAAVDKLLASGAAYRDFDGDAAQWRGAPEADVAARVAAGEPHAVRFRVPRETGVAVEVDDVVRGTLRWADVNKACREDFVLARRDGRPLYVLCSAADDAALGVSHVVRAEEHVSNTLRQALVVWKSNLQPEFNVLVLDALGATRPTFAHVPLVVDAAGKKLSKRRGPAGAGPEEEASEDGARGRRPRKHAYDGLGTVAELRAAGCTPLGLANYLASLGWAHETAAFDSLDDLAAAFDLGRVSRAASAHDPKRLAFVDAASAASPAGGAQAAEALRIARAAAKDAGVAGRRRPRTASRRSRGC
ncbi:glutamyl-tRNA synthetase [Aureococcus anophagefferens]|uniref:Glutamyl-tRNA synthetase n=1 Tax=Aureococcus anophagefferens TaxID=44056 RepID=A0ABR1FWI9_AURAN